ncbi:MAG: virulence protein RhuM/Fic/DOC family protein [Coxiellaceae bacterium]|nr:virulence protein RhuM/Fic/DOC family protein [Coxiellaceae bacterium]
MSDVIIYKAKDGHIELSVNLDKETVWLTQRQLSDLFDKNIRTISEHIQNIFKEGELIEGSVIRKFRITAGDGKSYDIQHYNLDVIISVGYRVRSKRGTEFRQWATTVLKQHLIGGYSIYKKRLAERGVEELQQSLELLQQTLTQNELVNDIGAETIRLINHYAKTWSLLLAYDEDQLTLPQQGKLSVGPLNYQTALDAINALKVKLAENKEASALFGNEREHGLESILGNIEQTFDGEALYATSEQRAAHLFYFVIKDHPFSDGNKRIGCLIFLLYLKVQNIAININDNGLVALALLVAESKPTQKDLLIRLIVNLLAN